MGSFPVGKTSNGIIPVVRNDTHWQAEIHLNYKKGVTNSNNSISFKYSATESASKKAVKVCRHGDCCLALLEGGSCTPAGSSSSLEYVRSSSFCGGDQAAVIDNECIFCLLKTYNTEALFVESFTSSLDWKNLNSVVQRSVSIACESYAGSSSQVTDSPPN